MRSIIRCFLIFSLSTISLTTFATEEEIIETESCLQTVVDFCRAHPRVIRLGIEGASLGLGYVLGGKTFLDQFRLAANGDALCKQLNRNASWMTKAGSIAFASATTALVCEALLGSHQLIEHITTIDIIDSEEGTW